MRENEILEKTNAVACVWGCYCPKGYLRDNSNGRCVPESKCRRIKLIDISEQTPIHVQTSRRLKRPNQPQNTYIYTQNEEKKPGKAEQHHHHHHHHDGDQNTVIHNITNVYHIYGRAISSYHSHLLQTVLFPKLANGMSPNRYQD